METWFRSRISTSNTILAVRQATHFASGERQLPPRLVCSSSIKSKIALGHPSAISNSSPELKPDTHISVKMTGNALSATGFNTVDEEVLNLQDFAPTNTFGGAGVYFSGSTPAGNRFIYGQIQITYPGAAQLSLDKSAINFGNQPVGPTYAKQTVHLKNTGTSAIIFSGTIISGTGASAFASSSTCGTTIAPGDSCASAVTFTPTAPGGFRPRCR